MAAVTVSEGGRILPRGRQWNRGSLCPRTVPHRPPPCGPRSVLDWWGVGCMVLTHIGPIEGLYYAFHRLLHHEFLWSRYHSHHHSSFVTDPARRAARPRANNDDSMGSGEEVGLERSLAPSNLGGPTAHHNYLWCCPIHTEKI